MRVSSGRATASSPRRACCASVSAGRGRPRPTSSSWVAIVVALTLLAGLCARADITNTVPWSDSFEGYTNGALVVGTNGWTGQLPAAGVVTNWLSVTNYQNRGGSYPLAVTHSNVLALNAQLINNVSGATGGVVKVDFLAIPAWSDSAPPDDASVQCGLCVSPNGFPMIWHYNKATLTNEWRELPLSTPITAEDWHRFTITHDSANKRFQVAIDENTLVTNAFGWTQDGGQTNGSWFYLVQTNAAGAMSQMSMDGTPVYMDDLVAARRSLAWSRTNFAENATCNGAIDNSTALTITLGAETFAATQGENLVASGKMTVSGLPPNLAAVAQLNGLTTTQVVVTLTGAALVHELANSTNLTVQFANTAFTLGNAWDVLGSQTNVALVFSNTPSLSYSANTFTETTTNNGSIGNSCVISLTNGSFAGASTEDFASPGSAKVTVANLPAGLTGQVLYVSSTQLTFSLLGAAISNNVADNTDNVTLAFQNAAFVTVPASNVFNSITNFSIRFTDPSALTYSTTVFRESVTNDGTVSDVATLTLTNKAFNANPEDDLATDITKVMSPNLPAGLVLHVVCVDAWHATLSFGSNAMAHALADSRSGITVAFGDAAFVGGNATGVANASVANLQVLFTDPRTLTYSGLTFTETAGGVIDNRNPVTITLAGDTLTGANGGDLTPWVTVGGTMPPGLTARFTQDSATQISVRVTGIAWANSVADSVTNLSFIFQDGAFNAGNAQFVGDYQQTGVSVIFTNDTGFFNVTPYQESFEEYANGLWLAGTNGWSGDSIDACIVTNDAAANASLRAYATGKWRLPIDTTHTQVLYIQDTVKNEISSEHITNVFVDFMITPSPMWETPMNDISRQSGFYVTTNGQLVVWQQTYNGNPEWITLSNAPTISTSQWTRFTVQNDYAHNMFQLQVNQGKPITDSRGWTAGGMSPTGSWFFMVQTNGTMSEIEINGAGKGYLDDFTVLSTQPATLPFAYPGTVFLFR